MKTAVFLGKKPTELNGYRADEIALAKISDCNIWLEGDVRTFNNTNYGWFDRARNTWLTTSGQTNKTKLENGFLVPFDIAASTNIAPYGLNDVGINRDEWSVTFVAKVLVPGVITAIAKYSSDDVAGSLPLELGWNSTGRITVWGSNYAVRLQSSATKTASALAVGNKVIITATFSIRQGLSLWCNGVKVAENTTDINKITTNRLNLNATRKCGNGHILIHAKDLNLDENLAEMGLLHQTLMDYYQIPKLT